MEGSGIRVIEPVIASDSEAIPSSKCLASYQEIATSPSAPRDDMFFPVIISETLVKIAELEGVSFNQYMVSALSRHAGRDEVKIKERKNIKFKL